MTEKGYKLLNLESKWLYIDKDVTFYEQNFPYSYVNTVDCTLFSDILPHITIEFDPTEERENNVTNVHDETAINLGGRSSWKQCLHQKIQQIDYSSCLA